jgi:site-specific DNA-methyltransferase (adenine-specific)
MARGDRAMKLKDYEYFRTDLGVLYKGDFFNVLHLIYLDENIDEIDLVLTDPPYGIKEAKNRNKSRGKLAVAKDYGNEDWDDNIVKEIESVHVGNNKVIIFGGQCYDLPQNYGWIVWHKDNGKTDFSDCELAWTNFLTAVRYYKFKWQGMLQENMKNKEKRFHPTQKPTMLFYKILQDYTKDHDLILDPFLGSGTTAVACEKLGRRWIGIEISEKYCEIAKQRIKAESDQFKMF